jgi:hypothetical protein
MTDEKARDERYRGIASAALKNARELPRFRELEPKILARFRRTRKRVFVRDGAIETMLRIYRELSTQ